MHRLLDTIWYRQTEGLLARVLLAPLWLLSLVYGAVVRRRRRRAAARAVRAPARVISVGNLCVGGAGKTPVAIYLARRLRDAGARVVVLSRGYGRRGTEKAVVSDGERILLGADESGDEPALIAAACPGVPVMVGADRAALAKLAVSRFGYDTLVLDDGFQHLRLHRDLDLVVVDASNPFGNGHLIPRGPLREGRDALAAAQLAWISKVDQADPERVRALAAQLEGFTGRKPVEASYRIADVLRGSDARSLGPGALAGRRVMMVAGLARPGSFRRTLESAGAVVVAEALLPDHHRFSAKELQALEPRRESAGAEMIATTEKDAVRIPAALWPEQLVSVRIACELRAGEASLEAALAALGVEGRAA